MTQDHRDIRLAFNSSDFADMFDWTADIQRKIDNLESFLDKQQTMLNISDKYIGGFYEGKPINRNRLAKMVGGNQKDISGLMDEYKSKKGDKTFTASYPTFTPYYFDSLQRWSSKFVNEELNPDQTASFKKLLKQQLLYFCLHSAASHGRNLDNKNGNKANQKRAFEKSLNRARNLAEELKINESEAKNFKSICRSGQLPPIAATLKTDISAFMKRTSGLLLQLQHSSSMTLSVTTASKDKDTATLPADFSFRRPEKKPPC